MLMQYQKTKKAIIKDIKHWAEKSVYANRQLVNALKSYDQKHGVDSFVGTLQKFQDKYRLR